MMTIDFAYKARISTADRSNRPGVRILTGLMLSGSLMLAEPAAAQQLREITIGMPSTSLATAFTRLAKNMGLFEKQGLDARLVNLENASVATTALVAGSVQFTISGPGELIAAQARGQKVITIATTYGGLAATLTISKALADKSGLTAASPLKDRFKALDGAVIGASSATAAATIVFKAAAEKVGGANLRFVYISQTAMPSALEAGSVQGFVASAPFWMLPVVKGTGVAWVSAPKGELPAEFSPVASSLLQTMRDFADKNPELMKKVQSVYAEFSRILEERPGEVKQHIAKTFPDLDTKIIDLFIEAESMSWKLKPLTAEEMAKEIAFMKANGADLPGMDKLDPATMVYR